MKSTLKLAAFLALDLMAITAWAATPKMPTFFARRDYPGLNSFFVQVADTNGDKIPDLIVNGGSGFIQVQFGNGDGTFRSGPSTHTSAGANFFLAIDLNGDGKIDLVQASGGALISFGNGDGTFQSGILYPINDNVQYLALGDFNADGIPDIVATGNSGVWLLSGKGGGTYNPATLVVALTGASSIAAADFNLDGKLDLAITLPFVGTAGGGFCVLLGNGNGTFQTPQMFSSPPRPIAIAVGNLTKYGPPGIVVNDTYTGDAYLYFGNGKGGFSGPRVVPLPNGGINSLLIGDINGDGLPDLVSDLGYIAYGEGLGYFTNPVSYPVESGYQTRNAVLADLRNNGLIDIVTGGNLAISVLLNLGKGFLEDGIWTNVTGGAGCGAAGDFNGDGKPDLAVNTPSGVSILLGTGKYLTPFTAGTPIALAGAECLVTGDLNGDGKADLLVPVNGAVNAYLGNGNGTFALASSTPTPSGGYLALGDFNHDGKLDFATSGNLIALGNGDGTFQNPTDIVANPAGGGFSGIAVGDINSDGWPDLVLTSNQYGDNATVLLNNQHGGFTQVPTSFGDETSQPILVDLNADGNLDLVLEEPAGGEAAIYIGNGQGGFASNEALAGPFINTAGLNLVADINGDGIPDICVLQSDTLQIYLGQGGATYAAPFSIGTGPSPGSILVENLHGQSPKAGLPDIVIPDTSGGVMVLFNLTP
jgi:hypothetical protein